MHAMQELLLGGVIPELRLICRARGGDLTAIDLRQVVSGGEPVGGVDHLFDEMSGQRSFFLGFIGSRHDWIPGPHDPSGSEVQRRYPWLRQGASSRSSITELEVLERVLDNPLMAGKSLVYIAPSSSQDAAETGDRDRLDALVDKARGAAAREAMPDMDGLRDQVRADLLEVIDRLFPPRNAISPLESERRAQEAFARTRRRAYVEAPGTLRRLDEHAESEELPLVVTGGPGAGKSALLAYWADRYRREHPDAFVITHYIGATSSGGDHRALLRRIMAEIKDRYDLDEAVPISAEEIDSALPFWLGHVQREKLILVIDALNQLDTEGITLDWLPEYIQPRVRLVVSAADGAVQETLHRRGWGELQVEPLTLDERKEVVRRYLGDFTGKFSSEQLRRVSGDSTSANPLFLRTRLEELRMFESSDRLNERIDHYLAARDLNDLFQRVLQRLEDEHGEAVVRDVMTLVWGSRRGLTDEELAGITGADAEALASLIGALEYHLMRREGLLAFFHDHLRQAVENRYIEHAGDAVEGLHLRIARYFSGRPIAGRRVEEEPWQLQHAHAWPELKECLADITIFRSLCGDSTLYQLMGYWLAIGDRYDMEEAYRQSLALYEAGHGDDGDLPALLDDLGRFFSECGHYDEAERLCRRSLAIREQALGSMHIDMSDTLDTLAELLYYTGRMEEAVFFCRRALAIREQAFGEDSPEIARTLSNLGVYLQGNQNFDEAESVMQRALALIERQSGTTPRELAMILNNLGALRIATKRYEAALPYSQRARQLNERMLGAEHPEIAVNLANIAFILQAQKDFETSSQVLHQALAIGEKVLGPEHPQLAVMWTNLGCIGRDTGALDDAERFFRRALLIRQHTLGSDNLETIYSMLRLGAILKRKGNYAEAYQLYSSALVVQERICGTDDPVTIRLYKGLEELKGWMEVSDGVAPGR